MFRLRSLLTTNGLAQCRAWLGAAACALLAVGCTDRTEPGPDRGLDYYPVAVGSYWIYAVADSTWSQATDTNPRSTVQASAYQFREAITESFSDATKKMVYRLVRSKRSGPADAWKADSVFIVSTDSHGVVLTRNNLKTLELIFPVRDGHLWNSNAYNNNTNDTVLAETRRYRNIGQPYTTAGSPAQTYPTTVTTTDEGSAKFDDSYYVKTYTQVFAKGAGPVARRRRRFSNFYTTSSAGVNRFFPKAYFYGFSRTETLLDYGPR